MSAPTINPTSKVAMGVWNDISHVVKIWDGKAIIVGNLINFEWDNLAVTYPIATTEVYTFKLGAAAAGVITVVYTDATKEDLLTVTRA